MRRILTTTGGSGSKERSLAKAVVAWGIALAAGLWASVHFASSPARTNPSPEVWPARSAVALDETRDTLLVFIHPQCPCSRATLSELCVLLSQCHERPAVKLVFVRPEGTPDGWERSSLWQIAQGIPDGVVSVDSEGDEADRFGATTSGEAFLFAGDGRLRFHGGLTWARGHEGDSKGRSTLASLINSGAADASQSPVYGCALSD